MSDSPSSKDVSELANTSPVPADLIVKQSVQAKDDGRINGRIPRRLDFSKFISTWKAECGKARIRAHSRLAVPVHETTKRPRRDQSPSSSDVTISPIAVHVDQVLADSVEQNESSVDSIFAMLNEDMRRAPLALVDENSEEVPAVEATRTVLAASFDEMRHSANLFEDRMDDFMRDVDDFERAMTKFTSVLERASRDSK